MLLVCDVLQSKCSKSRMIDMILSLSLEGNLWRYDILKLYYRRRWSAYGGGAYLSNCLWSWYKVPLPYNSMYDYLWNVMNNNNMLRSKKYMWYYCGRTLPTYDPIWIHDSLHSVYDLLEWWTHRFPLW